MLEGDEMTPAYVKGIERAAYREGPEELDERSAEWYHVGHDGEALQAYKTAGNVGGEGGLVNIAGVHKSFELAAEGSDKGSKVGGRRDGFSETLEIISPLKYHGAIQLRTRLFQPVLTSQSACAEGSIFCPDNGVPRPIIVGDHIDDDEANIEGDGGYLDGRHDEAGSQQRRGDHGSEHSLTNGS